MITVSAGAPVAAINASLVVAAANGGGIVALTAGHYSVQPNETIRWPANGSGVSLTGEGMDATFFDCAGRSTDLMVLTAGSLKHASIRDIGLNIESQSTGGAVIHAANNHNLIIEKVGVFGLFWDGIVIDGGPEQYQATLNDVSLEAAGSGSYRCLVLGDNGAPEMQEAYLSKVKCAQSRYGIWCGNASGVYASMCEMLQHAQDGFVAYPHTGEVCEWMQFTGLIADSCGDTGIYLGSGGGLTQGVVLANCWSGSNGNVGMQVVAAPFGKGIRITAGTMMLGNANHSIVNYGAADFYLDPSCYFDKP